ALLHLRRQHLLGAILEFRLLQVAEEDVPKHPHQLRVARDEFPNNGVGFLALGAVGLGDSYSDGVVAFAQVVELLHPLRLLRCCLWSCLWSWRRSSWCLAGSRLTVS